MNTVSHDGYVASLQVDVEAGVIHGEVLNTRVTLTFSVKSVDQISVAFRDTIEDYKTWCAELGEQPERPYSGTLSLRISPRLHQQLAREAAAVGRSLNAFIAEVLEGLTEISPSTQSEFAQQAEKSRAVYDMHVAGNQAVGSPINSRGVLIEDMSFALVANARSITQSKPIIIPGVRPVGSRAAPPTSLVRAGVN